jgi:predicted small secreted protein
MKKLLSVFAIILLTAILLPGCNFSTGSETSDTQDTTAEVTDNTTTGGDTTNQIVITPPDTTPPVNTDMLRVLGEQGTGEALTSFFSTDESAGATLDRRRETLLADFSVSLLESRCTDIVSKVKNDSLTLSYEYDLLLLGADDAMTLLCLALLENVGEAGIEIDENADGVDKDITSSLKIGDKNYLFTSIALSSAHLSSYALKYNGGDSATAEKLASLALGGELTHESFMAVLTEISNSSDGAEPFSIMDARENIFAYLAFGGTIYTKNALSIPLASFSEGSFARPYNSAMELEDMSTSTASATFVISPLTSVRGEEMFLPLPRLDDKSDYITPVDVSSMSFFASPLGVENGKRLRTLVSSLALASSEYNEWVKNNTTGSHKDAAALIELIGKNKRLDIGLFFGWGDIDELVSAGVESGKSSESFLSERTLAERIETVKTAVEIITKRLDIEVK